ncbi:TPA: hypothetical protein R4229_001689 [Morganella morganii]|nr:hypothetical protein [Morganella morganii]
MSDPLATILTHLTNLVSFKSSLRLLLIAGLIICSWVFIEPNLSPFNLPSELSITLITVIGFSLGALVSSILFNGFDLVVNIKKNKITARRKKIEFQKKLQENEEYNHKKIELIKRSFNDYSSSAHEILLKLKDDDCTVTLRLHDDNYNTAFDGLIESEVVLIQHKLEKNTFCCTINPLYKEAIKQSFEERYRKEVDELFELNPTEFNMLIKKFQNLTHKEDHVFNIVNIIYKKRYNYYPIIKFKVFELGKACDNRGKVIDNLNIYFYIPDEYYPFICEKLGGEVRKFVFGNYNEEYNRNK